MGLRKIFGGLAIAATMALAPMTSSAITLTGEAVKATIENEFAVEVVDTAGGLNVASLSLGPFPAEYNANISVVNNSGAGFTADQDYTNDTGFDLVFQASTLLQPGEFLGADLLVAVGMGAFMSLGAESPGVFAVGAGETFTIRAFATDVLATANFDYTIAAVPLPAGFLLLLTGVGGLALVGRRRRMAATA